jgi:hypothetical protein
MSKVLQYKRRRRRLHSPLTKNIMGLHFSHSKYVAKKIIDFLKWLNPSTTPGVSRSKLERESNPK